MDKPIRSYRLRQWGFRSIVGVIAICTINGAYDFASGTWAHFWEKPVMAQKQNVKPSIPEIPLAARSCANDFVLAWLNADPKVSPDKKIEQLKEFVTPEFLDELQNDPTLLTTTQAGTSKPLRAVWTEAWGEKWTVTGKEALVYIRAITEDGRRWFFDVPVKQSGNSWFVSGLPALVPGPAPKPEDKPSVTPELDQSTKNEVTEMLNNFFKGWLNGESETVSRYTNQPIPTANLMDKVASAYRGVQVEPISDKPLKVKARVQLEEGLGATIQLEYVVTIEKRNGQWYVTHLEM